MNLTPNKKAFRNNDRLRADVSRNFRTAVNKVVNVTGPVSSLQQLAELLGLQSANLTAIMKGTREAPLDAAIRLCDLFNFSYSFMLGNKGDLNTEADAFGKIEKAVLNMEKRLKALEKK